MTKHPQLRDEPRPDHTDLPVPNRRERRGGKSGAQPLGDGKSTRGRSHGVVPNPRQYSTRRRGG